jgi:signal transduction histidine kinase
MNQEIIKILIVIVPIIFFLILIVYHARKESERSKQFFNASERLILRKEMEQEILRKNKAIVDDQHERLYEMKRLAEFGRLSRGLFHDLMNPLTAIILHTKNLNLKDERDVKKYEVNINSAVRAGETISLYMENIRNTLNYEHGSKMCSFIEEIEKVILLLSYRIRENNIKLNKRFNSDYISFGNPLLIQHIFTNLISNAIDSLEMDINNNKKEISIEFIKEIDNFIARIYDNGLGIDDNKINKIFEPFYTTKEKNKGIGIGLTIVKSIVEEKMLGKISVNNNKKKGVCFTIKLPL